MASISTSLTSKPPNPNPFHPRSLPTSSRFLPISAPRLLPTPCRASPDPTARGWDSVLQDAVKAAVKRWESYVGKLTGSEEGKGGEREVTGEWDWERWERHFKEMEEQEKIVSVLKSRLYDAVHIEDYKNAAKLQRAIAAALTNDDVGCAIKDLNKAINEECYLDAANIRDRAGSGLIGWWAGTSDTPADPFGRIIRITAEYGRYVAKSYSSRQLASGRNGFPLFEIYYTLRDNGEYKHQAVYLKRNNEPTVDSSRDHPKPLNVKTTSSLSDPLEEKDDLSVEEDVDIQNSDDDSDIADGISGIQNVLQDMIPGVKVKVLKVVSPGKVDKDMISKVIEQIVEDDDKDIELENDESEDDLKIESDSEEIIMDSEDTTMDDTEKPTELSVNFVVSGVMKKFNTSEDLVRVPAVLENLDRFTFSFSVTDKLSKELDGKEENPDKISRTPNLRSADLIMSDLAKVLTSKRKIPLKVLKDIGELINLTVNQDQSQQPLHGKMYFNRINIPTTSDPLSGLYISARGMFSSEVLYLRHQFGQWQEDGSNENPVELKFYEYVEALKLTGDASVPAGQVAFRAKVGQRYQLPHKGIIPEEFGVVARYKGQGRLAEPGFRNPRWVDGELVILNGKFVRSGPVIGFVYWAPDYQFLTLFNRLRLED